MGWFEGDGSNGSDSVDANNLHIKEIKFLRNIHSCIHI